jgi:hypothetical protein
MLMNLPIHVVVDWNTPNTPLTEERFNTLESADFYLCRAIYAPPDLLPVATITELDSPEEWPWCTWYASYFSGIYERISARDIFDHSDFHHPVAAIAEWIASRGFYVKPEPEKIDWINDGF